MARNVDLDPQSIYCTTHVLMDGKVQHDLLLELLKLAPEQLEFISVLDATWASQCIKARKLVAEGGHESDRRARVDKAHSAGVLDSHAWCERTPVVLPKAAAAAAAAREDGEASLPVKFRAEDQAKRRKLTGRGGARANGYAGGRGRGRGRGGWGRRKGRGRGRGRGR